MNNLLSLSGSLKRRNSALQKVSGCLKLCGALAALLLLNACTTPGTPTLPDAWQADDGHTPAFFADGRLSVKDAEGKGSHASFDWLRGAGVQIVDINSPLGSTVGRLCRDAFGATAQNARGEIFQAADSTTLSRRLAGVGIALDDLDLWALGRFPADSAPLFSADGALLQNGWQIRRSVRADGTPRDLHLSQNGREIRMIFDTFIFRQPENLPAQCPRE